LSCLAGATSAALAVLVSGPAPGEASGTTFVPHAGTWYARPAARSDTGDVLVYFKVSRQRIVSTQVAFERSFTVQCTVHGMVVTYFGDRTFHPNARIDARGTKPQFHIVVSGELYPLSTATAVRIRFTLGMSGTFTSRQRARGTFTFSAPPCSFPTSSRHWTAVYSG